MKSIAVPDYKPVVQVRSSVLARLGVSIPVACFALFVWTYAVNVPWMDDFDAFFRFMIGYADANTLIDKLYWLIRPNNEHRILTAKLATLVLHALTGEVNFRWLVFVAFGFQFGIFTLFYRGFRSLDLPLLAFVPVALIYWQPQYHLTSVWALTGLQHEVSIFEIMLGIYLLSANDRPRYVGALGVQVLASLSMGNGIFGWVSGAVVLFLQRQWLRLGIWVVVGLATIKFYFYDFPNLQGNESSLDFFLKYPYLVFSGFFTFSGALFDFMPDAPIFWRSVLPTLAGLVLIPLMLWLLWRMNWPLWSSDRKVTDVAQRRRYFFTGCYAFLMVNAVIIAFLRPRMGYWVMMVSNYMIYPAVLTSLIYLNGLSELRKQTRTVNRWLRVGLITGGVVWTLSYGVHWPEVAFRKQLLLTSAFNHKTNDIGLGPSWGTPFADFARQMMRETRKRGLYHYPDGYFTPYETALGQSGKLPADSSLRFAITPGNYSSLANTTPGGLLPPISQGALLVQSGRHTFLFPSESPFSLTAFYLPRPVQHVEAEILNNILAPGSYRLGVLAPSGSNQPIRFSNQRLAIPTHHL